MRSNGFSLVEMMVALVVAGLIVLIGWPRFRETLVKSDVRSARGTVLAAYARARAAAIQSGRSITLQFSGTSAWVTGTPRLTPRAGSTSDTVGAVEDLSRRYGVTVSAAPVSALTIDPRGFTSAALTTVYVSRAGFTDSVVISGFGRVLK